MFKVLHRLRPKLDGLRWQAKWLEFMELNNDDDDYDDHDDSNGDKSLKRW